MGYESFCELSRAFYSKTARCEKCRKVTASHFIIDGLCKECYVKEMKTHEDEIYTVPISM